jgi:hypothetical protein
MAFSITENGHTALLPVWSSFSKISKFKLKQVYVCNPKYFRASRAAESLDLEIRLKIQRLL